MQLDLCWYLIKMALWGLESPPHVLESDYAD